jgi:hypothetical protein
LAEHLLSGYMKKEDPARYRRFLLRCVGDTEKQRLDCVLGSSTRWASLTGLLAAIGLLIIVPSFFLLPSSLDPLAFVLFVVGFSAMCVSAILGVAVMEEVRLLLKYAGPNMEPAEILAAKRNRAISTAGVVLLMVMMVALLVYRFTAA